MEETNYHRKNLTVGRTKSYNGQGLDFHDSSMEGSPLKELRTRAELRLEVAVEEGRFESEGHSKNYCKKLRLFDKQELQYPNRLKDMIIRPLVFLTFPVISYAGFSYGSNIVWFNVLNGTTSLILSADPYRFGSSIIGLAYIAPFIGMTIGYLSFQKL